MHRITATWLVLCITQIFQDDLLLSMICQESKSCLEMLIGHPTLGVISWLPTKHDVMGMEYISSTCWQ